MCLEAAGTWTLLGRPETNQSERMETGLRRRMLNYYEVTSVLVWGALILAVAIVLQDTPYLGQLVIILGGGAAFFVVILPSALSRMR